MKHIAILGSSLISVIEAITQAKLGNKVSIIDKSEEIGGAWKLENSLNYKDVEVVIIFLFLQEKMLWIKKVTLGLSL